MIIFGLVRLLSETMFSLSYLSLFNRSHLIQWTKSDRRCCRLIFLSHKSHFVDSATNVRSSADVGKTIRENTEVHASLMVPELSLHLITPSTRLWKDPYDDGKTFGLDPFWSIFWPGGQALCRYILDGGREKFLAGKRVLDLGCGSGAACLAAIKAGAKKPVYANDIDQVALMSVLLNADVNGIPRDDIVLSDKNYLDGSVESNGTELSRDFDVLFIGDMYYDDVIGERVTRLVRQFVAESNPGQKIALVGDPGRWYLSQNSHHDLKCLAKYHLTDDVRDENYGFTQSCVYAHYTPPHQKK